MFIFGKEKKVDKVNKEIESLKQQKEAIQQEINALKQEKVEVSKEIDSGRETLAVIESEIANGRQTQYTIDGMEEYGIPYYGDSIDELEHRRFDAERVNKDNTHKEFFHGDPADAIEILEKEFGVKVVFANEEWIDEE